jgi:hypothetical protein
MGANTVSGYYQETGKSLSENKLRQSLTTLGRAGRDGEVRS